MEKKQTVVLTKKDNIIHMIKFTLFSISAGVIQISSFTLFSEVFHLEDEIAHLIALILSVLWNFTLNRKFTFKSAANIPFAMFLTFLYYLVFTPASTWYVKVLNDIGWNKYIVEGSIMIINFVTEFIYQRFVVFRNKINTAVQE